MPDDAYKWNAEVTILQGGYPGEWHGAEPPGTTWQPGQTTGTHTALYYYADSNAQNPDGTWGNNDNSSQILINVSDSWTATVDPDNNVTIMLTTTINSIKRGKILGNPNLSITNGRDIRISRYKGSPILWQTTGDPINIEKTLITNLKLGTETFVLKPGTSVSRSSIYILNHTSGVPWETPGSTDEMTAGVSFRNDLPADYRPGATFNGVRWGCNNNSGGACNVWTGSSWQECRTENGGSASDNSPFSYNGSWLNQYKIGNQN